ncbi:hypothetical protein CHS0354_001525, partial [Potamilus streckersoni]
MEISALFLAFLFLSVDGRGNEKRQSGPDCLHCLKVAEAHDCEIVVTCEEDEECFRTQYITPQGHVFFDLGCKSKQICDAIDKYGKRSQGHPQRRQPDGRITLCEECCTGILCNSKSCDTYNGAHVYPESNNRRCYACSGEQSVEKP